MKMKSAVVLACSTLLILNSQGANVAWVSFHAGDDMPSAAAASAGFTQAPDVAYTQLLSANGHTVNRIVSSATPDAGTLNGYDLIIVSRSVPSAHYQDAGATAWNSITAPMIVMSGYTIRNNRMGFTTGTTIPDTAGAVKLAAQVPSHPVFAGIGLDGGNVMLNDFATIQSFMGTLERGISINTNPLAGGGTILGTIGTPGDPAFGGMAIGEWLAGSIMGNAAANVLAGHRLVFLSGSREHDGLTSEGSGIYDLTGDGAQLFLNAVNYMAIPEPSGLLLVACTSLLFVIRRKRFNALRSPH